MQAHTQFDCNICGHTGNELLTGHLENPELPSCLRCGSNVRFRWLVHALSSELLGASTPLSRFPEDRSVRGLGLTDPAVIAAGLERCFSYRNTFFDSEPKFDIRSDPSPTGPLDFLIASEVFEHVTPPVANAFENAAKLLKPSGLLLLTVPWVWDGEGVDVIPALNDWKLAREGDRWVIIDEDVSGHVRRYYDPSFDGRPGICLGHTREHFPELREWEISELNSAPVLINRRKDGVKETFRNIVFHGGPDPALEMRLFTRASLEAELRKAGFASIRFDNRAVAEYGIVFPYAWSHPVIARRCS
jgi:SAM-dependent methyltransferase